MKPILALISATLLLSACKSEAKPEPAAEQPAAQATPAAEQGEAEQAATSVSRAAIEPTLKAYETIRKALAGDDLAAVPGAAKKLAAAAKKASSAKQVQAIASASDQLAKQDPAKPDEMRKAFGEVSRQLVELLQSSADLRKGLYVFECPMAQGYKRWVQPNDKLENPYMGKKMLRCGSGVEWSS